MNKWQRHRLKCQKEGRCPHCGKPCLPYSECEDRRHIRKVRYTLNRLILSGLAIKNKRGYTAINGIPLQKIRCLSYNTNNGDSRLFPRIGKQYFNLKDMLVECLKYKPLTEEEIEICIFQKISDIKLSIANRKYEIYNETYKTK